MYIIKIKGNGVHAGKRKRGIKMNWKDLLSIKGRRSTSLPTKNPFEQDYFEIITSSAFRRLQDKTQVYSLAKNDYVRTRLTHSIEVATIAGILGREIWEELDEKLQQGRELYRYNKEDANKVENVLQCTGLLHDIGVNGESMGSQWGRF